MSAEAARTDERSGAEAAPDSAGFWEQAGTLVLAVLVALAIRSFVVEPQNVDKDAAVLTVNTNSEPRSFADKHLIDRGGGVNLSLPFFALLGLRTPTFEARDCPFCQAAKVPLTKPGSRDLPLP